MSCCHICGRGINKFFSSGENVNAIVSSILAFLILVVLFAPRRWAILGMMGGVLYLTQGQSINIIGFNMYPIRFLEIAGFVRIMIRREFSFQGLNEIDGAFIIFYSYLSIVHLVRTTESSAETVGIAIDALLCYFTFRGLINNIDNFRLFCRDFIILLIPYVGLILWDFFTIVNYFVLIGGVSEHIFREGLPRCLGSFRHSITLGTLGASFLPFYIGMVFEKKDRARAFIGIVLCVGIVLLSNSGGPLNATIIVLIGWLLWFARGKMRFVMSSLIVLLILIAIFMKAPIWYLPAKVSDFSGGGGWHRSYLLEQSIKNISKWWIAGMPSIETADWMPYILESSGGADITNQYISLGLGAGLGAIALFFFLLKVSFSVLSGALKAVRAQHQETTNIELLLWSFGIVLAMHIVNWIGVCYYDQIKMVWFMQLAAIASLSQIYAVPIEKAAVGF